MGSVYTVFANYAQLHSLCTSRSISLAWAFAFSFVEFEPHVIQCGIGEFFVCALSTALPSPRMRIFRANEYKYHAVLLDRQTIENMSLWIFMGFFFINSQKCLFFASIVACRRNFNASPETLESNIINTI